MRRWMRSRRTVASALVLVIGATLVTASVPAPTAQATSIVPFRARFSANDNGSIAVFGNNLMVCPPGGDCAATRAGATTKNNNQYRMVHLDVDGDPSTFSSSSADVSLPAGAEVRWAGLYWGARLGAGVGGAAAVGDGRQMKLRAPGDATYRAVTASSDRGLFGPSRTPDRAYQAYADVTSIVAAAGPGTYLGADVPAATGEDRYSGWSLVVVYRSPSLPLRNLTVFDGLADVGQNDPQVIEIAGFRTPVTGDVNARIGLVAYEGDRGSSGDRAILRDRSDPGGTLLSTALSQGTNFFNGANDDNGTLVRARNPADTNMLGFDIKNFDGPGILGNDQSSAQIDLASTSERYFPGVVTTAIDVFAPDFSPSTKTVTNDSGGTPARVGDRLRYTVTFVNGGQDPATNWSIRDPIPPGTTFVPGSQVVTSGTGTASFDGGAVVVTPTPAGDRFELDEALELTFDVIAGPAAANTDVSNRATITYDGATVAELQDLTFSTAAASIPVVPTADVSITKVNTPDPVVAGEVLTSTLTVRNDGPSSAADVTVSDELPAGLGAVTATSTQGTCTVSTGIVRCAAGTLAAGQVVTVTVQAQVPPGSTAGSLTDGASVRSPTADPDPDDNAAGASTPVARDADLSVAKAVVPATVPPGGTVTYTITVTNDGPSTASSVVLDDAVPDPRIEPRSASVSVSTDPPGPPRACSTDPSGARCLIPSLDPGATAVMTVTAVALTDATAGPVPNGAIASSATPDGDPSDNTTRQTVTIGPPESTLLVTKTADAPTPLLAGAGQVRYTIDVTNTGPSDADPVTVDDVLPPGFTVVAATSDRGACTVTPAPTGDAVSCALGRLVAPEIVGGAGARGRVTITARIAAGVVPGTYDNVASADAPSSPPTPSPSAPVTVEGLANVAVSKAFPQGAVDQVIDPGTTETYRIRVVNDGPSVAADVEVTDVLPTPTGLFTPTAWRVASVTPPGPTPTCVVTTATCELGDLPPGTEVELELDVFVDGAVDATAAVTNTATATSPTPDPNPDDNTSTFTVSAEPRADVSIRKFSPPGSPIAGDRSDATLANRTFRIEIANFGPATTGFSFTDTLPPGMTFRRFYDFENPGLDLTPLLGCTITGDAQTGQTVSCSPTFALPPSVGVFFGIEFEVAATVPDGTVLQNEIDVTSTVPDGNPGNNSSTAVATVRAEVNLRLTKLSARFDAGGNPVEPLPYPEGLDPLPMPAGYSVGFVLVVENLGPSAAAGVQVADAFEPDSANFETVACDFLNGEVVCPYTTADPTDDDLLLPGQRFEPQLLFVVEGDTPQGVYTNRARVSTTTTETTLDDNADQRTVEIVDPVADLIIEKDDVTSPLVAGETFTYQITVSAGRIDLVSGVLRLSSDAEDVVVTDTLPDGLVPAAATASQGTCTVSGQEVTCRLDTVESTIDPARQVPPALVTVTGTVAPDIAGATVANTATATTATALLGGTGEVSASTTTPIVRRADLDVTKVAGSPAAAAGGGATFTVTVTNAGPSTATGVVVDDLLPAPLVFDAAASDPACSVGGGSVVVCALGDVDPGEARSIGIAATSPADADAGSVTNLATVTAPTEDPNLADNSSSATVEITREADLSVTKAPSAEGVLLGETIAYALVVTNNGPSDAVDVVVTDDVPPGLTVDTLPPGCGGTESVTCTLGTLAAGDTITLDIVLGVPESTPLGALTNTASVSSATEDPIPDNDVASAVVEAIALADVVLEKSLVTSPAIAGQPLVYELTLTNRGPTIAPNPSLSDPLAPGTTFIDFTAPGGTCQLDQVEDVPAASCSLAPLAVGASVTATLTVGTDPTLSSVANTGFSGSGGLDENPADNEDTVETLLERPNDIGVTVTAEQDEVPPGSDVSFVVVVTNNGPQAALGVVLVNELPPELVSQGPIGGGTTPPGAVPAECSPNGLEATCAVGDLGVGERRAYTFAGRVADGAPVGSRLVDTATVSLASADAVAANNAASDEVVVTAAPPTQATTTTTTIAPSPARPGTDGGGGRLAATGAVVVALLTLAALLVLSGGGLRGAAHRARRRR